MTTIIGFGHRSRSGKDTAAATIIEKYGTPYIHGQGNLKALEASEDLGRGAGTVWGSNIRRYAFADALKREVNTAAYLAGGMAKLITEEVNYGRIPIWVKYDPNAPMDDPLCPLGKQRLLLQWWGTDYRRSQDEDYWVKQLKKVVEQDKPEFALITDFRFPNEAKILDFKVKIERDVLINDHPSEHALDNFKDWDIVLLNDSSVEALREKAIEAFEFIRDFVSGKNTFYDRQSGLPR